MTVFEPCTLQVGDRSIYTLKENDVITTREQWRKEQKRIILKDGHGVKAKRKRQGKALRFWILISLTSLRYFY